LIDNISNFTGKKYGSDEATDKALRVVVEHGRALTFLIADGVMPSNEKRGYVLRRLLRRASLFGRRLGLDKPFLNQIAGTTVGSMTKVYPELQQRQNHIFGVVQDEEERFQETLKTGLELLNNIVADKETTKFDEILGVDAFRLYDTYGFPIELTKEIAQEQGLSVDMEGFEREMAGQKERAKTAHKFVVEVGGGVVGLHGNLETSFVGYGSLNCESKIVGLSTDGKSLETIKEGQKANLILESTPFYGEMGGQVGDTGEIVSESGKFVVTNTVNVPPDVIVHQGKVVEGSLNVGDEVEAIVDVERRMDIARNHTATHLLQFALRQILGEHVQQRGSLVAPDRLRFDFSHLKALSEKQIAEVNKIVNEKIRQNLTVSAENDVPYQKAIEAGVIALFDEKYGDVVRVLKIGKPLVSAELCGGTHVSATGEIGLFHIISESSIGAGLRRIEAVTGRGAEEYVGQRLSDSQKSAQELEAELDKERKKTLALEKELARKTAESLIAQAEVIKGVKVLAAKVPSARMEILREMSDIIRDKLKSAIVVLGTAYQEKPAFLAAVTPDLVKKGYNAGKIVKQVAEVTGGGGGGKADFAQAGGKDKKKLDEALRLVKSLV
jgi:alanyl-tRNA synthetase